MLREQLVYRQLLAWIKSRFASPLRLNPIPWLDKNSCFCATPQSRRHLPEKDVKLIQNSRSLAARFKYSITVGLFLQSQIHFHRIDKIYKLLDDIGNILKLIGTVKRTEYQLDISNSAHLRILLVHPGNSSLRSLDSISLSLVLEYNRQSSSICLFRLDDLHSRS